MNERDLETRLRDAYRVEAGQADPGALSERVHSIPATVEPPRQRWWHDFGFGAARSAGPGGIQVRGASSMFTATRIAAVVAALALGTTFMAAQVGPQSDPAERPSAPMGESWVTVTGTQKIVCSRGSCTGTNRNMSDDRLGGDVAINFELQSGSSGVWKNYAISGTVDITNDDGSWHGQWIGFVDEQGLHHNTAWYEGAGGYEGLKYIEDITESGPSGPLDVVGLVYDGEMPATVVPPAAAE